MIAKQLRALRPLTSNLTRPSHVRPSIPYCRYASQYNEEALGRDVVDTTLTDPEMNGGYVNPPPQKRVLRDPYAEWWDKQERRNFGEPVHEDNDVLGVFSTDPYTHAKPSLAWSSLGAFVATTLGVCFVVAQFYPDKPSAPRTFTDGLDAELGGSGALLARKPEDQSH